MRYNFFGTGGFDGSFNLNEWWICRFNQSNLNRNEVKTKICDNFILKKRGMTLEQQLEEIKQQRILEEQQRIEREKLVEHNRLFNRLRRNWYYVSALAIAIISLIVAIWKLFL